MRAMLPIACGLLWSAATSAAGLEYIGQFRDIRVSETQHCYGFDVILWQHDGATLLGLLSRYAGPCADPACSVVTGERNGSRVSFVSRVPVDGETYRFTGSVHGERLTGTLNSSATIMIREEPNHGDTSRERWCEHWQATGRCDGVTEFCRSMP